MGTSQISNLHIVNIDCRWNDIFLIEEIMYVYSKCWKCHPNLVSYTPIAWFAAKTFIKNFNKTQSVAKFLETFFWYELALKKPIWYLGTHLKFRCFRIPFWIMVDYIYIITNYRLHLKHMEHLKEMIYVESSYLYSFLHYYGIKHVVWQIIQAK